MTINNDAIIEECLDTADIPEVQYEFVPIQSISSQDDKANIGKRNKAGTELTTLSVFPKWKT